MNLDEETEEAVRRQRAANCPIRAFLDALPEASPETLKNLNELGDWIGPPRSPRSPDGGPYPDSKPTPDTE